MTEAGAASGTGAAGRRFRDVGLAQLNCAFF